MVRERASQVILHRLTFSFSLFKLDLILLLYATTKVLGEIFILALVHLLCPLFDLVVLALYKLIPEIAHNFLRALIYDCPSDHF